MDLVGILTALLVFALIGFVLWLIVTYIPMPDPFAKVIVVVAVVLIVLYLIGVLAGGTHLPRFGT
jgi:heme A synthase